ncbi:MULTISPECIES: histidine phosphatase family protein [unclassified Roseateles]|uniref:SixA phosphatase family protein n=1 Tax=unclassified Roseateles TaxID=2626991 RepID=UPI0006FAF4C3|nr:MULTISPECIES: histidine phosphatase family protein [unclassified Roseateles]KQW52077.1 phosphohistidine phosphatase [Pelomonas sp. Root405]KRA78311.1 phosphohistidine phosphatase [Pelomonas sp. Root662]
MDLILWRHAEAEIAAPGQDDLQRALTPKGERQARRMAAWLNHRLAATTRVLVSPALRCRQTAEALGREVRIVPSIAPDAPFTDLIEASRWPRSAEPVLLCGHQPTLGQLAAHLLAGVDQDWAVRKGAVWWLRWRQRDGEPEVTLHAVQGPDCL